MLETQVWSLVQEDSTCPRATKPVHHNYWAFPLEPGSHSYWKSWALEPLPQIKRSHHTEKPVQCNWRAAPARWTRERPRAAMKTQHSSVQFSHSVVSNALWLHESQHARPPCPSPTPGVHWDSRPSSWWCHPTISSYVVPFSHLQSFPASRSLASQFDRFIIIWPPKESLLWTLYRKSKHKMRSGFQTKEQCQWSFETSLFL